MKARAALADRGPRQPAAALADATFRQTQTCAEITVLAAFDPRAVAIESCGLEGGGSSVTIQDDEEVVVVAQIRNGNDVAGDVSVEFITSAGQTLGSISNRTVAANTTESFSTVVSGGVLGVGSHSVVVNITNAVEATAPAGATARAPQAPLATMEAARVDVGGASLRADGGGCGGCADRSRALSAANRRIRDRFDLL